MKRRDFVIRAAKVVGTFPLAGTALGQVPCPPDTVIAVGGTAGPSPSCPAVPGQLVQISNTPEQIAVYADASSLGANAYARLEYKALSASGWTEGHPLYRIRPGTADDAFAGCIFDLQPGTTYDIRVTFTDQTGSTQETAQFSTRRLPADVSQRTPDATPSSINALQTAIADASPGDVIELQNGTYSGAFTVGVSGTPANPIYIRGQSRNGTVVNLNQNQIRVDGDHIVLENMTINGGWPAESVSNSGQGVRLAQGSGLVTGFTLRNVVMSGVTRAVQSSGGTTGFYSNDCLIYNNDLTGSLSWSTDNLLANLWNNDGIRLVGSGNCVWNNRLEGFSDTITFAHSVDENNVALECNYAYRNFIRNSLNDTFELDHSQRLSGVYDNYVENCDTGISQSDNGSTPNFGPSYVFRNIWVNVSVVWIKFNAPWQGWHYYNNTIVRTRGAPGDLNEFDGFRQNAPTGLNNDRWAYRNNIHIARHNLTGDLFVARFFRNTDGEFDISHNAFFPDDGTIQFKDAGPSYRSANPVSEGIAANDTHNTLYPAGAGLSPSSRYMEFDVVSEANPFSNTLTLGATSGTEVTGRTSLTISGSSDLKNAGVAIPGITDGFSGAAPDIGALIGGRAVPNWGPS
ncbi:MAG: chondroitinase-B domain-containing protein [Pseudomonadota bacterium]